MTNPEPTLNARVAEELRATLARRRLSASELARMTGMTQRAVSRRLTGEKTIDVDDLEVIARALDMEVADLLPTRARASSGDPGVNNVYCVPSDPADDLVSPDRVTTGRPEPHVVPAQSRHAGRGSRRPVIQPWAHEGVTA